MFNRYTLFIMAIPTTAACAGQVVGDSGRPSERSSSTASALSVAAACTPSTRFFVPKPNPGAVQQITHLLAKHDFKDAASLALLVGQPQAVWFTDGDPSDVESAVKETMRAASREHRVPVLVAYDIPFRDCAQYSAGGALDTAAYEAWIDGFARGIGGEPAVVVLEPDSLGIIPWNTTIFGAAEWCQPTVADASGAMVPAPEADPAHRYAQLGYAVSSLKAQAPSASVYLDGTHSAWLGVGEAAYRLHTAGAEQAQGFFLNVSNFQTTDQSTLFGTWVSDCLIAASAGAPWALTHFDFCPSQYDPATGFGLDYSPAYAATVTAALENMMAGATPTAHFIVDTSRNGRGPLDPTAYAAAPFDQPANVVTALGVGGWCNPFGAGAGRQPTADTGVSLADAYLWVKLPGESDGQCDSAGGARAWDYSTYDPWSVDPTVQASFDPLWGIIDPAAGAWFPSQALQLAQNATPPLAR